MLQLHAKIADSAGLSLMFMFDICKKKHPDKSTEFSEFIRKAPSRVKKRVFTEVLNEATEAQSRVIREAYTKS